MKNMFKTIKTLFVLVLAIVMVAPVNALAEGTTNLTEGMKRNLTVSGLDTTHNEVVSIYKVMDVSVKGSVPVSPAYTWTDNIGAWVHDNYEAYAKAVQVEVTSGSTTSTVTKYEVTKAFSQLTNNGTEIAEFYDALAAYIKASNIATAVPAVNSGTSASVTFSNLDLGGYFILVGSGARVYRPTSINVVPEFVTGTSGNPGSWIVADNNTTDVSLKSTTPTISKVVTETEGTTSTDKEKTDAQIGTVLPFTIKVLIPNYPVNAPGKKIVIGDTFGTGLTFNDDVKVYGLLTDNGTPVELTKNVNYKYEPVSTNGFKVTIDGTAVTVDNVATDMYETVRQYKYILVKYTGTVNADAEVTNGASNDATLDYNNDPYNNTMCSVDENDCTPPTDIVTVYTYGFDLKKVDKDDNTKVLTGAKFTIANSNSASTLIKFTGSNGVYVVAEDQTATTGVMTELEVASDGTLKVSGLELGTYVVTETKAPEGYSKLAEPLSLTIKDDNLDGKEDTGKVTGYFGKDIENSKVYILPVTGGMGTLLFSVIGIVFMGLGAFLVKNVLKKEQ